MPVGVEVVAGEGGNALLVAEDGARHGLIAKVGEHDQFVHHVLRRILGHGDFLQHHALLLFQFHGVELRRGDEVGKHVDGQRQVFIHHLGVKAGAFLGGKGVELPAHGVHFLGDLAGGALLRALEGHVLEEVADAGLRGDLILRARAQPQAHGHGAHMVEPFADEAQAVGKRDLIEQWKLPPGNNGCIHHSPARGEPCASGPRAGTLRRAGAAMNLCLTASGDGRRGRARRARHRGAGDGARAWIRRRTVCRCG